MAPPPNDRDTARCARNGPQDHGNGYWSPTQGRRFERNDRELDVSIR
jgi:hypothetical protein